jgi:hypothetical protein
MIARICRKSQVRYEWLNDRELLLWCRAVIYSQALLSSTNAYQATYRSPEAVLSALIECYE